MKFALMTSFFSQLNNYGDFIQTIAIEHLYHRMGISTEEIVSIGLDELITYEGEDVLLPWNYAPFVLPVDKDGKIRFSQRITPVFLGFSLAYYDWERKFVSIEHFMNECGGLEFLKKHEPIGCRDEYTFEVLSKHGVRSYLQGCITNILPKRNITLNSGEGKVLLIDCNSELLKHIPNELLERAEAYPNEFFANLLTKEDVYKTAKKHYEYIRDHAELVISGRFHIVTPCYAMGIPTIFVERFMRFDQNVLVNPMIPQYTYEEFDSINWSPSIEDFDGFKDKLATLAEARIREVYERSSLVPQIRGFYEPRISSPVPLLPRDWDKDRIQTFVKEFYRSSTKAKFYLWGAKPEGCRFGKVLPYEYIKEVNPRIEFLGWIDTFKEGTLAGFPIYGPDAFCVDENTFIIIYTEKAISDALKKVEELGMRKEQMFTCTYIRNIEPRDLNRERTVEEKCE